MKRFFLISLAALLLGVIAAPELAHADPEDQEQSADAAEEASRSQRARSERQSRDRAAREEAGIDESEIVTEPGQSEEDVARQVITGEIHRSATGGGRQANAPSGRETRRSAPSVSGSQADPDMAVLFFRPLSVQVTEGEEFSTQLVLSNPRNLPFDRASLALLFNSAALEPIDQEPGPALEGAAEFDCGPDPDTGYLMLSIAWEQPVDLRLAHLMTFHWRARREVRTTDVSFLSEGGGQTFVGMADGGSILGNATRESPGLIAASVRISPDLGVFLPEETLADDQPWIDPTEEAGEEDEDAVVVRLVPRVERVARGDVFDVDVQVINPSGRSADTVALRLRFDSDVLEVLDTHEGNWIEQGINIWDGGYHALYPFDLHVANRANNDRGEIDYRMGFTEEVPLPSGTVATIRFRALRSSSTVNVDFLPVGTSVRFLGEEMTSEESRIGLSLSIDSRPAASAAGDGGPIS